EAPARDQRQREKKCPSSGALRSRALREPNQQENKRSAVQLAGEPDPAALCANQIARENVERRRVAAGELRPLNDQRQNRDGEKGEKQDARKGEERAPERVFARG